jgi:hypothetical protein
MRAMRYSSILSAFNEERRSIKPILLYNGLVCQLHLSQKVIRPDTSTAN